VISDEEIKKGLMTLNIIWCAMLISLAIYLFVGLQVAGNLRTSLGADTYAIVRLFLYILAFVTLIAIRYVRKLLLSAKGSNQQRSASGRYPIQNPAIGKYVSAMIVAWAMSEGIGIYGLVLFFLGKNVTDLYLLLALSAATMCFYRPKREEITSLSQDSLGTTPGGVG
jgi:hypothetical protein